MGSKRFKMPSTMVLLVIMVVIFTVLTWVLPAGTYDRFTNSNGVEQVDPESYHEVESTPVGAWRIVTSIPAGLQKQAGIIFFLLLVGGSVQIISASGIVDASLGVVLKKLGNKDLVAVPVLIIFFAALSCIGINTAMLSFVPIGLMISKSLKLDNLVGVSIVMMGVCCGWSAGPFSANTTGIAQNIIGLPMFSGYWFRLLTMAIFLLFICTYVYRYCKKIRNDPAKSLVYGTEAAAPVESKELPPMTTRRAVGLAIFLIGFCVIVYGAVSGWSMNTDIAGVFMVVGVLVGIACGMGQSEIVTEFARGVRQISFGALVCGFAGALNIVLSEGHIIDTIVHAFASIMYGLPTGLSVIAMFLFQTMLNLFIPAGSSQAIASIPIASALGYILDIEQQVVVLAFNFGDGITNQIYPTAATIMASIGMAGVAWEVWAKYVWKMILGMIVISMVMLEIAVLIGVGPF